MKLTLEEAEAWYRQDENCKVTAHEVATFYHGVSHDLRSDFLIILEILDKNTESGYPMDPDTADCYYCDKGILEEDDWDDALDLLESLKQHKESCWWRKARELFDREKIKIEVEKSNG